MKKVFFILVLLIGMSKVSHSQWVPKERAKELQTKLKLNENQTAKITGYYTELLDQFHSIIKNGGTDDAASKKIDEANMATKVKIKAVLTKEQNVAYEQWLLDNLKKSKLEGSNDKD